MCYYYPQNFSFVDGGGLESFETPKKKFSLLYVHLHYERFPFNAFSLNKFNENLNG